MPDQRFPCLVVVAIGRLRGAALCESCDRVPVALGEQLVRVAVGGVKSRWLSQAARCRINLCT